MSGKSKIEWTDATLNPVTGCTKVSPGCDHCYAERMHERFNGPGSFAAVTLHQDRLDAPLRWRKPRRVFVNSMSDLFHRDVPDEFISQVWATMAATPLHTYQILTKRHARMRSLLSSPRWPEALVTTGQWPNDLDPEASLPNVWLGVSVESQEWVRRIRALVETPAAVRFLSCEPLLGPIQLQLVGQEQHDGGVHPVHGAWSALDWVIVGGESGPGARPMHPAWARSLRDQCVTAGVPFFFKQWGEHDARGLRVGKKVAGRLLDGRTWDEYPEGTS